MNTNFEMYYTQIGLNIAFYRKLKRFSQLELAEKVNISRTHISNIEAPNMRTRISMETLFEISVALDVEPCKLLEIRGV